jgi:hypothetical protein
VLRGVGGHEGVERVLEVTESERRMEGVEVREEVPGA